MIFVPRQNLFLYSRLIAITSIIALFIASCTGIQTAQDYLLNNEEGLVYFTLTKSGKISSSYQLKFVNESNQKVIIVSMNQNDVLDIGEHLQDKKHYREYDKPLGKLVVLRLPEAVYRFDSWQSDNQQTGKHSLPKSPNKKFKVSTGHALYLGNIHLLSDKNQASLFIRDNREHDRQLFFKRYPRVDSKRLLVASKIFLDPAKDRDRVFESYTGCPLNGYELFSINRLPTTVAKFRTLKVNSKDKKISRIDGYRMRFRKDDGAGAVSMKVELSEVSRYVADKKVINEWMDSVQHSVKNFEIEFKNESYFSEYQLKTNVLDEKRMAYMSVMLDDVSQMITSISFINPPEFLRRYKTMEEFVPQAQQVIADYQQCVIKNLNKKL